MIHLVALVGACALFWASDRLFRGYVHAVAREERRRDDVEAAPPRHHAGPKFFLVADFIVLLTALWSLSHYRPFTISSGHGILEHALVKSVLFSGIVCLWALPAARRQYTYYVLLSRSVRRSRLRRGRIFGRRELNPARVAAATASIWAATPLVLAVAGIDVTAVGGGVAGKVLAFAVWFVAPLAALAMLLLRDIWPIRRQAYRS